MLKPNLDLKVGSDVYKISIVLSNEEGHYGEFVKFLTTKHQVKSIITFGKEDVDLDTASYWLTSGRVVTKEMLANPTSNVEVFVLSTNNPIIDRILLYEALQALKWRHVKFLRKKIDALDANLNKRSDKYFNWRKKNYYTTIRKAEKEYMIHEHL